MHTIIVLAVALVVSFLLYSSGFRGIGLGWNRLLDKRALRKAQDKGDRKALADLQAAPGRASLFASRVNAAMNDNRLLPVQVDEIGPVYENELDDKGKPKRNELGGFVYKVDENDKPIPKLDDKGEPVQGPQYDAQGNKIKRYKFEKRDPTYGVVINPGNAPTWRKLYTVLLIVAVLLTGIGFGFRIWALAVIGFIVACVRFHLIMKNGKACMESTQRIYQKVLDVVESKLGATAADPHEIINIDDWEYDGEARDMANARTRAAENGESEKLEKMLPQKNPKTGKLMRWPIATFRTQPASMVIDFPAKFNDSGEGPFIEALNLQIGARTVEWVAKRDVPDPKTGRMVAKDGWDYNEDKVYLRTMPPLPDRASLPDDLDATPWNTIRLGRGVDGEIVWDLSGEGFYKGDKLHYGHGAGVTTPMALVPLGTDTEIWVAINDDDDDNDSNQ